MTANRSPGRGESQKRGMNEAQTIAELLAPETLARIDNYAFLARTAVDGFVSGLHRSLYHGFGSEFFQYRSYVHGDDFKYMDWKVFARRDRFVTKVFQEETNMSCCVLLDASASMDYRGRQAPCGKLRYAAMAGACLAYLASRQGDNIGFYAYSDALLTGISPGHRAGQLQRILLEMTRLRAGGTADHAAAVTHLGENLRRRGVLVWISDFLEAEGQLPALLKQLRFAHQDCVVIQVLDPDEVEFSFEGTLRFVDAENESTILTAPERIRDAYRAQMQAYVGRLREACLAEQVDYLLATTRDNLGHTLAAYLHRREALHGC